jgi:hypothetical protein
MIATAGTREGRGIIHGGITLSGRLRVRRRGLNRQTHRKKRRVLTRRKRPGTTAPPHGSGTTGAVGRPRE